MKKLITLGLAVLSAVVMAAIDVPEGTTVSVKKTVEIDEAVAATSAEVEAVICKFAPDGSLEMVIVKMRLKLTDGSRKDHLLRLTAEQANAAMTAAGGNLTEMINTIKTAIIAAMQAG